MSFAVLLLGRHFSSLLELTISLARLLVFFARGDVATRLKVMNAARPKTCDVIKRLENIYVCQCVEPAQ